MILLVEDSIRFYSSILPNLYNYIPAQRASVSPPKHSTVMPQHCVCAAAQGGAGPHYEEAMDIYSRYADNIHGVISDVRFPVEAKRDAEAGLKLLRAIRKNDPFLPLIMESSEAENREKAEAEGFRFVDKNSKKMSIDLRRLMEEHMGFGDFIFRDPVTHAEIMRIHNLEGVAGQHLPHPGRLHALPYFARNHMSRWLSARAIFPRI